MSVPVFPSGDKGRRWAKVRRKLMKPRVTPEGVRRRAWALPWFWRVKRLPVVLVMPAGWEDEDELAVGVSSV